MRGTPPVSRPSCNFTSTLPRPCGPIARGFTIIELLVVISVIAILIAAAGPAIRGMSDAQGVDAGIHDIAGFLEMARNEALTRHTYVWVGLLDNTTSMPRQLQMGAVSSIDGSGTNTSSINLKPFTKVLNVRNVALSPWGQLQANTKSLFSGSGTSVYGYNNGLANFSKTIGSSTFDFSKQTITFTPQGQAMLTGTADFTTGYSGLIDISLRQAHGLVVTGSADDAAIIIDGAIGTTSIIQQHL